MDSDFDIAIVGLSCRLPGAQNLEEFWRNLAGGVDSITRFSDREMLESGVPASWLSNPTYVKAAPVLAEPGQFDAGFFGFSPMEAKAMDPQHRILLELAHEALEHAGHDPARCAGRIGVFTGSALNTYFTHFGLNRRLAEEYIPTLLGNDKDFLSTRISYKLNLKGPSLTVQTACSTSMVAIHLARQSLLSGETDVALAGAMSVRVPHRAGYFADSGGIVSPDGQVRAFDAGANGTVFGSGGGILVLKRLADALADGDTIHAVIKGSAVNNDGAEKAGYAAPSVNAQADAVVEALANAGIEADQVSYLEAHGSGTPVGDPIEIRALTKAFRTSTQRSGYCAIGSVKTNVGHLDAAAGVAGTIKTVLALKHRKLPPSLHFRTANPEIDFPNSPFYVNTELRDWKGDGPRRAAVMATGMGGTNACVILEEAPEPAPSVTAALPWLLVVSARTEAALDQATQRLQDFLSRNEAADLGDVAYTLQLGRKAFARRRCLVCRDGPDASSALGQEASTRVLSGRVGESRRPLVLMLPGIGDHYVGMGHDLYETWGVFRQEVDRCAQILARHLDIDIRTVIYPASRSWTQPGQSKGIDLKRMLGGLGKGAADPDATRLNSTLLAQPALFTIEYALARLWQSLGVAPDAIVGHSMGEYVAACLAGVLSLEDALQLIAARARLVDALPKGAMLAVALPENELRDLLPADLSVSLINGPSLCVAAGPPGSVAEFEQALTARGVIFRHVQNAHAFHSRMLDPIVAAFEEEVRKVRLNEPKIPYISNVSGTWITAREATSPSYWAKHANRTARFGDALRELWRFADPILLEAGPGRTLGVLAMQHPARNQAGETATVASLRHRYETSSDSELMLEAVGRLWLAGVAIDWSALHAGEKRRRVALPTYPFEKHNYWLAESSQPANTAPLRQGPSTAATLDDWFYVPTWERVHLPDRPAPAEASWLLFTDRWGGGTAFRRKLEALPAVVQVARFGEAFRRRIDGSIEIDPASPDDYLKLFREIRGKLGSALNIVHLGCLTADQDATPDGGRDDSQAFGCFSLLHLAQAIDRLAISIPIKIGIVSNRMHEVTGEESLDPEMATVLGPCGVIPRELANVACFNVDLRDPRTGDDPSDEIIARVLSEFGEASPPGVIAYRGKHRWKRKYERVRLPNGLGSEATSPPSRLRQRGVYLITGGTGGIGLALARYLAENWQARIVLTGRTAFPEKSRWPELVRTKAAPEAVTRVIAELLDIERLGAEVEVMAAEVSNREAMGAVVRDTLERYQTINGVIHAAGIVKPSLIGGMAREAAERVLVPKVRGTRVLFESLQRVDLDFLVLFSSMSSVTFPYAHADYSAANSFLDAFAGYSNSRAKFPTLAINWPVWKETGIGAGATYFAELQALLGVEGLQEEALERAILTRDGLEAFTRALNSDLRQIVVSPENLDHLIARAKQAPASAAAAQGAHPAPLSTDAGPGQADPPNNEVEAALARIWMDVFGHEQIGVHQQFSALGGHSLIAMQIVSKIRAAYRVNFTLKDFFEAPSIAQLSAVVEARARASGAGTADEEPIRALPHTGRRPLTSSERRLWFFDQFEPGSAAYNAGFRLAFDGEVRIDVLERSMASVVARHDALRTRYLAENGDQYALIDPPAACVLSQAEATGPDPEAEAVRLLETDAERPFNLTAGPLWRALLVRMSGSRLVLGVTLHHIVADGWSIGIFTRELLAAYTALAQGPAPQLPDLSFQYSDFAAWEANWIRSPAAHRQLEYWRERLAGVPQMDLPGDFPRPRVQTFRGASCTGELSPELNRKLSEFSRAQGATPFMTLLAAFGLLLHRLSGVEDVPIGVPIAGRERKGTDRLIGMFVNTIVLRQDHSRDTTFVELLGRTRSQALEGYSNAEAPFDQVVNAVHAPREAGRTPLFQVLVNTLDFSVGGRFSIPGVEVELEVTQVAASKFDLTLYLGLEEDTTWLMLSYNADLFAAERMQELVAQFQHVLEQVLGAPERRVSEISLRTPGAAARLPDPTHSLGGRATESLPAQLARRMKQAAERIALAWQGKTWTHADLAGHAQRLAGELRRSGLQRQDVVAIYAQRAPLTICAMVGVLEAGGAFAVFDPSYPETRLAASWRAAKPRGALLVGGAGEPPAALQAQMAALAPERCIRLSRSALEQAAPATTHDSMPPIAPEDLAYVAFTSGTTGGVKAILGTHAPVVHFLDWQARTFALGPDDRFSMLSGLSHDPLLRDVFAPLWVGASLHVPDPAHIGEPGWLADWIAREQLTVLHLTPAMAQLVVCAPDRRMDSLRWIFLGGDALSAATVDRLRKAAPNATCVNFYGATETPQAMGCYVVPPSGETRARVPVGRGIDEVQLLVVTARDALAGVGELGEIVIRTPHLALGYGGDAELTQARFTLSPFSPDPADRVYRTGDLGRYLPDGNVEFCGRADGQAKLRGFRLELGAIETALREHPSVSDAMAIVREDSDDERRLLAYVVAATGRVADGSTLRSFLRQRLPEYAIPAAFARIDAIPLTPNGKVDRKALPAIAEHSAQAVDFEPPLTPTEEAVAAIFADVLRLPRVGRHERFFDLGGHSLLATQAAARASAALGVAVSIRALFEAPTPAGLGAHIDAQARGRRDGIHPLPRRQHDGELPLSFSQQRLWFLNQIEPDSAAYNLAAALRLRGRLDRNALRGALSAIVARHDALRTVLRNHAGTPVQVVLSGHGEAFTLRELSAETLTDEALALAMQAEVDEPFDLERGPLLRTLLYRRGEDEHIFLLSAHHIVLDAWSMGVFVRELAELYEQLISGTEPALPPLPLQYADFTLWQHDWLRGEELERLLAYWRAELSGAPTVVALPTDQPRPAVETYRGARHRFVLPSELQQQLLALSRREGATLFMSLLAGFSLLLSRYSGQDDIVVGTPVANRRHPELGDLIGFFVNTLLLRTQLTPDATFRQALGAVRERCLGAYAHQDLPFEKLVEELRPERDTSRNPLFQVMLVLQNAPLPALALRDVEVAPWPLERHTAQVDLTLYLQETEHGLHGVFEYATDLFEATTIERMTAQLRCLLEGIAAAPDTRLCDLALLPAEERRRLLAQCTGPVVYAGDGRAHELFEAQVERAPRRSAVKAGANVLSYADLDTRANRLAQALRARGAGPGQRIGLCVERDADMLASVLAILKCGAAYVPLDPSYPAERLRFMAHDAELNLLVSTGALAQPFALARERQLLLDADAASIAAAPASRVAPGPDTAQPHDPAYVIYTSGSTGQPKGVMVPHRALINFLSSMAREPGLDADDVLVAVTTLSFDIAVLELQLPLSVGATVVIATHDEAINGQALTRLLEQHRATVMQATPVTWRLLLEAGWTPKAPFKALIGGEALPKDLAEQLIARGVELWNMYGPTETTVWSTCARITDTANGISIGKPIANTTVYILDANKNLCPIGVPGELYIGGEGVTLGYWNRPGLTAERFIPDPFSAASGARLYRTGDRGRWRNDGTLEHLGRLDDQAKVRGFRIELGEIEAVLAEHPDVRQAAVRLWTVKANDVRLVACCVPAKAGGLAPTSLRKHLRARLPEYMIPQHFLPVEEIPLTPNGKIDRNKLPTPAVAESGFQQQHEVPTDPLEVAIAEIWANLIGPARPIGRADKFFEMGGHSLLALRALRQMEQELDVKVDLRVLFHDSVAQIATQCRSAQRRVHAQL